MKVVINACHGGFGLSPLAIRRIAELRGGSPAEPTGYYRHTEMRADPFLIQVVEELGKAAWGRCAELKIVEIPSDVTWEIEEYDGAEWVSEKHRTWS